MTDAVSFPELETDTAAIEAFVARHRAKAEDALHDAEYHQDVATLTAILEDDSFLRSVKRRGRWVYNFLRTAEHPKGLWRRVPDGTALTPDAPWQAVFDLDAFCAETGTDWHWRGALFAPTDAERIVLALSLNGSDQTRLLEWDAMAQAPAKGGFDLGPERCSASWLDPDTLLFSTSSGDGAATRSGWPGRVLRLKRGQPVAEADIVFEADHDDLQAFGSTGLNPDGRVDVAVSRMVAIGDIETTYYRDGLDKPGVALPTPKDTHASFNHTHYAYITTHDAGGVAAGSLVLHRIGSDAPGRVLYRPKPYGAVLRHSVSLCHSCMFWIETLRTEPTLWMLDLTQEAAEPVQVTLPCEAQALMVGDYDDHPTEDGPLLVMTTGFLVPPTLWVMELPTDGSVPVFTKLFEQPARFDADRFEVCLDTARSQDGTEVPYHIVMPRDRDGPLPVLQYGYGGFGVAMSASYLTLHGPVWLERGGAFVMTYIRGGSEFGGPWHQQAKRDGRERAFADFAAVAEDLVARGYSEPSKIACNGGSNGGLLCSVMLTRYPKRFGAVWAQVAVTDMLRFHLFPAGAAWIDEYGDPDVAEDAAFLRAYSPVHNVVPVAEKAYPPALISTSAHDDRVDASHSRRFSALLEEAGQDVLFHTSAGGHGGGGSTREQAESLAQGVAFLRKVLRVP